MKKIVLMFFLLVNVTLYNSHLKAQCAMCKSNLESARSNGNLSVGNSINNGIMYLFVLPYAIAGVFGFIYYRKHKLSKSQKTS